jgi:hypothetical protein
MTGLIYEKPRAVPNDAFRFLLDEPHVNGCVWQDSAGWHGCFDWGKIRTDYIGPYANRSEVTRTLLDTYRRTYMPTGE